MKQENFNTKELLQENYLSGGSVGRRKPRILVAPLDWGLGHATRCIPVIYELLQQECEVWIAAEGAQETLLRQEFPGLDFLPLTGYRVKYGKTASRTLWTIFFQTPGIIRAIRSENQWLQEKVQELRFDAVISDNRYGLYHHSIPSIFITHQLLIKTNLGRWSENWLQKRNYSHIDHFTECWVPDTEGEKNLAGDLSHPLKKPSIPIRYIGALSRFNKNVAVPEKGRLLILLSGPEPQRTILEEMIIKDIVLYNGAATIARGLPGNLNLIPSTNLIRFFNHLPSDELNNEMNRAEFIISRSGYSTIMDIQKLQKKSILIPTPGQTEQEYLGKYLHKRKMALCISQKSFSLSGALQQANAFGYKIDAGDQEDHLRKTISLLIQSLRRD